MRSTLRAIGSHDGRSKFDVIDDVEERRQEVYMRTEDQIWANRKLAEMEDPDITIRPTEDARLWDVYVEEHRIGSVRLYSDPTSGEVLGWIALGAMHFRRDGTDMFYDSRYGAGQALYERWVEISKWKLAFGNWTPPCGNFNGTIKDKETTR